MTVNDYISVCFNGMMEQSNQITCLPLAATKRRVKHLIIFFNVKEFELVNFVEGFFWSRKVGSRIHDLNQH